jgi:hypothetical protein
VPLLPNPAVRRFAGIWALSVAAKLAAIVLLVVLVVRYVGVP